MARITGAIRNATGSGFAPDEAEVNDKQRHKSEGGYAEAGYDVSHMAPVGWPEI